MAAGAIGAQVILDYNGSGSLGARGGAGATMEENTMARDAHLVALGLDPNAPSGPPTVPDPEGAVRAAGAPVGRATRISSLAAGIITGDPAPVTPPPPEGGGSAVPVNTTLPAVTQAVDTADLYDGRMDGRADDVQLPVEGGRDGRGHGCGDAYGDIGGRRQGGVVHRDGDERDGIDGGAAVRRSGRHRSGGHDHPLEEVTL